MKQTDSVVRIALIGAGRVAQHYEKIFASGLVDDFEVVAVCDIEEQKALELAERFSCPATTSIAELIDNFDFDLGLILTPSGYHFDHAMNLIRSGKHVLVEKPVTMRVEEAEQLEKAAAEAGVLIGVGFQNRFNLAMQALKQRFDDDSFGQITSFSVRLRWCREQSYYEDGWHGTWKMDGGVLNQQAIHHVDALCWVFGQIKSVSAISTNRLNTLEAEDTIVALIQLEDGAIGTFEATTAARPEDIEASISVIGEKGYATVGGVAINEVQQWKVEGDDEQAVQEKYSEEVDSGYGFSHYRLLREFIAAIQSNSEQAPNSIPDTMLTLKLVHAIYASAESGSWVQLKDGVNSKYLGV